MSAKSAMVTVVRAITVAPGVFAPGHLGELTQVAPFELVDAVLEESGCVQRRLRDLPSRVGVYFLLAMCLFPEVGYLLVWEKLVGGLGGLPVARPSAKALRDLRRRIGVAPVKALFEVLAGPLAQPRTPGARFCGYRTVSFDGCSSQKAPDTAGNRGWLGKRRGDGYPLLELMTLVETGTRALLGAVFGPTGEGESAYAARLVHLLDASMLVLWDKGFDGNAFLAAVHASGARILGRMNGARRPPVLARLPDGSYLSRAGALPVRIIEASITVTCQDGSTYTGAYRLVTTLTDHRRFPAGPLIALYHERWEHESAYFALRHTLMHGRILRSGDPAGLEQEMWALLTLYQILRTVMLEAAESVPGTNPDRASFTIAYQAGRDQLIRAEAIAGHHEPLGKIGHAILTGLLPPRRPRTSTRKVKSPISRYHDTKPDKRPPTSQNITALDIEIHHPAPPLPTTPPPPRPAPTPQHPAANPPARPSRLPRVLALMAADPNRPWTAWEIAHRIGLTELESIRTQLSRWAHQGLIHKTGRATYTPPNPLTTHQNP